MRARPQNPCSDFLLVDHDIRTGGPAMKQSAVYPRLYGKKVAELHQKFLVPLRANNAWFRE